MLKTALKFAWSAGGCCRADGTMTLVSGARALRTSGRRRTERVKDAEGTGSGFDTSLLEVLVCPLSKKRLRYDEETNELINDELGIAYPIINGIPNMIPQEARMIQRSSDKEKPTQP